LRGAQVGPRVRRWTTPIGREPHQG
jgi:hypothetical protein